MDLPKEFDCIPYKHFTLTGIVLIWWLSSVLKNKTENAKTYNTCNMFEILLSGVSEGSILDNPFQYINERFFGGVNEIWHS